MEITSGRWAVVALIGALALVIAVYVFAAGPIVSEIFTILRR